jgi:NDP-sugar pyrophosphorylase family protein
MTSRTPENLTAVVLAGGRGSRLMPHTAEIPKPLVEIGDRPVVEYLLGQLKKGGVRRVIMAVSHMADQIEKRLGDGSPFGLQIKYSHEPKPLSTVGPLKLIRDLPENFVVANGDILTDLNVGALYQAHLKRSAELTVATYEGTERIDYGVIEFDSDGRVVSFTEKPDYSFVVSMGIYVFNRSVLDLVPDGEPYGFDQLMLDMLRHQRHVFAYPYAGFWRDIGRPADYEKAQGDIDQIRDLL